MWGHFKIYVLPPYDKNDILAKGHRRALFFPQAFCRMLIDWLPHRLCVDLSHFDQVTVCVYECDFTFESSRLILSWMMWLPAETQMHFHRQNYLSFYMFAESLNFNPTSTSFSFSVVICRRSALWFAKNCTKLF